MVCIGFDRSNSHRTSHLFDIDPVVLLVSPHEPYVADLVGEVDCCNEPVSISFDVKYNAVVANNARIGIRAFNVRRGFPNGSLNVVIPSPESLLGVRMSLPELPQGPPGNDPHGQVYCAPILGATVKRISTLELLGIIDDLWGLAVKQEKEILRIVGADDPVLERFGKVIVLLMNLSTDIEGELKQGIPVDPEAM